MRLFILISLLTLSTITTATLTTADLNAAEQDSSDTKADVYLYRHGDDQLVYVRCVLPQQDTLSPAYYRSRGAQRPLPYLKSNDGRIDALYPVTIAAIGEESDQAEYIFRSRLDEHDEAPLSVQFEKDQYTPLKFRLARRHVLSDEAGQELMQRWRSSFQRQLIERIRTHEDHELELLLHWRFYGSLPRQSYDSWKREKLLRFMYAFSGLNDIEDAIPREQQHRMQSSAFIAEKPEPILLPQVPVTGEAPALTGVTLARYAPRSCYYIEWSDAAHMLASINFAGSQFDQWSQGTYPKSAEAALHQQMKRLGLSAAQLSALKNVESIAVCGWDPYIQSGTNLMLMIRSKQPLLEQAQLPHSHRLVADGKHVLLIATTERLITMALDREKSLAQVENFRLSRERLSAGDQEEEYAFVYLSDYWLTNFISPRWYILSARRRQVDARIRMASLLKEIQRAEYGVERSLQDIAQSDMMKQADLQWLLQDLEERGGKIVHSGIGGIGAHTPIDELSFDKVTALEKAEYEKFRNLYMRRWRQMDPIAFQVVSTPDNLWKTRLYVSPISNRSEFRWFNEIFLKEKQVHDIVAVEHIAAGISVKVATKMAMGMGMPMQLPAVLGAQVVMYDAAPSSYAPDSWLEEMPAHDWMSYMRLPAAVIMPPVLFQQIGLMGRVRNNPSQYEGLTVLDGLGTDDHYNLFAWQPENEPYMAAGVTPLALLQIKDAKKEMQKTAVPSDIHLWYHAEHGYHMTRKLLQLAVKNRTLASWRRQNRLFRISQTLGMDDKAYSDMQQRIAAGHYFPSVRLSASLEEQLPRERGLDREQRYRYSYASATRSFDELPDLLHMIKQLNVFISVESNALYFENHIRVYPALPGGAVPGAAAGEQEAGQTGLDFEE